MGLEIPQRFSVEKELGWKRHVIDFISEESMNQLYKAEKEVDEARREVISADREISKSEQAEKEGNAQAADAENKSASAKSKKSDAPNEKSLASDSEKAKTVGSTVKNSTANIKSKEANFKQICDTNNQKVESEMEQIQAWNDDISGHGETAKAKEAKAQEILAGAKEDGKNEFEKTYSLKMGVEADKAEQQAKAEAAPQSEGKNSEYQQLLADADAARQQAAQLGVNIENSQSIIASVTQNTEAAKSQNDADLKAEQSVQNKATQEKAELANNFAKASETASQISNMASNVANVAETVAMVGKTVSVVGTAVTGTGAGLTATGGIVSAIGAPLVAVFGLGTPVVGAGGATVAAGGTTTGAGAAVISSGSIIGSVADGVAKGAKILQASATVINTGAKTGEAIARGINTDEGKAALAEAGASTLDALSNMSNKAGKAAQLVNGALRAAADVSNAVTDIQNGAYLEAFKDGFNAAASVVSSAALSDNKTAFGKVANKVDTSLSSAQAVEKMAEGVINGDATTFFEGTAKASVTTRNHITDVNGGIYVQDKKTGETVSFGKDTSLEEIKSAYRNDSNYRVTDFGLDNQEKGMYAKGNRKSSKTTFDRGQVKSGSDTPSEKKTSADILRMGMDLFSRPNIAASDFEVEGDSTAKVSSTNVAQQPFMSLEELQAEENRKKLQMQQNIKNKQGYIH